MKNCIDCKKLIKDEPAVSRCDKCSKKYQEEYKKEYMQNVERL